MKINYLIIGSCLSLISFFSTASANNQHYHEGIKADEVKLLPNQTSPSYNCDIRILNQSYDRLEVQGFFDDGSRLPSFVVYPYDPPHSISLYYYGYCHSGMDIYINTLQGYRVYGGYTPVNNTIRIDSRGIMGLQADLAK